MAQHERPLSPFMHYRWQYTNALSILNRLTGVFMSIGVALLVYWLVAAALGPAKYSTALEIFASPVIKFAMFGWLASFYFHLLNGIRHLCWDLGWGFELRAAKISGWLVFISAIVLTVLTWACIAVRITATVTGELQ